MKSFASFRYYYFYFAWKCEAGSCVDFNLRLTITQQVLHTRSRFISYEVGFFVT